MLRWLIAVSAKRITCHIFLNVQIVCWWIVSLNVLIFSSKYSRVLRVRPIYCKSLWGIVVITVWSEHLTPSDLETPEPCRPGTCARQPRNSAVQHSGSWMRGNFLNTVISSSRNCGLVLGVPSSRASVTQLQLSQLINHWNATTTHRKRHLIPSVVSY